jgi:thymidylate synthase
MIFKRKTLQEIILNDIDKHGRIVIVRGMKTKEILDYKFNVDTEDIQYKMIPSELIYVYEKLEKYDYQIFKVLEILKNDLNSRQAILLFDIHDKMPECVVSAHFLIRDKKLICLVTSRSLDVKTKLYTDILIVKKICERIEKELNVQLKYLSFQVNSCHYYTK